MNADSRDPSPLASLPSVDRVLTHLGPRPGGAEAVRAELDRLRRALRSGALDEAPDAGAVARVVGQALSAADAAAYPPVVNATGVILHTGLGRAPLAASAVEALVTGSAGHAQIEVDPEQGGRRHRETAVLDDLLALTGAEAGTVVNNNAAALLLALAAVGDGRDALVSRGQLIEIGGGFRLPDLIVQSGCRLVEVGTTNRTYVDDFASALTWETGLVLVMHTSNYRVEGFACEPDLAELCALASESGVPVLADIGSGLLSEPDPALGLSSEPHARGALAAGADLVCFSGDKLLGGPQAGILVGRADLVARCRRHPLFRALRSDRLALTALAATLALHRTAPLDVPVLAALARSSAERHERAQALARHLRRALPGPSIEVVPSEGAAGSGSLPARPLPSAAVRVVVPGLEAEELARRLRLGRPSVFARVWRGQLQLDVAALLPGDDQRLTRALMSALAG